MSSGTAGVGLAAVLAICPHAPDATAAIALECHLRLPAQVRTGEAVPLQFELRNKGSGRLRVLTWNTPLEGWFGRYLQVTRDGQDVPYQGPQVKRGAPVADDYVSIGPGRIVGATVDLAQVYALHAPGRYVVAFDGRMLDVSAGKPAPGRMQPHAAACAPAAVDVVAQ